MRVLQIADQTRFQRMTTDELREAFLIHDLFRPGHIDAVYIVELDRAVVGSVVPTTDSIRLPTYDPLKSTYFTERRELGVLNIGATGTVTVNEVRYPLKHLDAIYIGRGNKEVIFSSEDQETPAEFYLLSYPAHAHYPTTYVESAKQGRVSIGAPDTANQRQIIKLIHLEGARSCQLVMGFTQLASGSVWNTMPPHTHLRRSEIYLYFDMPPEDRVVHLMGPGKETAHLMVGNKQVALSPGWSIHAGVGTRNYSFCWGMGGENQAYSDMDQLAIGDLL